MSHHGVNPLDPTFKDNWAKELANLQERTGATGAFPHGKLSESDDGEIAMAVGHDKTKGVVWIDFGKKVRWFGMEPVQVDGLCELLQKHKQALT
jgi:hypothetical protein